MTPHGQELLRRSWRCPCGSWAHKPGRTVQLEAHLAAYDPYSAETVTEPHDPGEQIIRELQNITGVRMPGCPYRVFDDPFVGEVLTAHKHWRQGVLDVGRQPAAIVSGVETYDSALNLIRNHDMQKRADDLEEERRQRERESGADTRSGFGRALPKPGRR